MKNNYNFCTLFDSNYLPRAIVNYKSLEKHLQWFNLYVYCFDDLSYRIISELGKQNIVAIRFKDIETEKMAQIRKKREKPYEFYWTCVPFVIEKTMKKYQPDVLTYFDADLMFFNDPKPILSISAETNVKIQPNNFSVKEISQYQPVGYYCSGWETFRNNEIGNKIVSDWKKQCQEWCFCTFEDDKFGDQKYLDNWRTKYEGVDEILHPGAGVAPWNIHKYNFSIKNNEIYLNEKWKLIYYHFHSFRMNFKNHRYVFTGDRNNNYEIPQNAKELIYKPYVQKMKSVLKDLKKDTGFTKYVKNINPEGKYHTNAQV
jgi:hypothetical protein